MSKKQFFLGIVIASIVGAVVAVGVTQFTLSPARQIKSYQTIEQKQNYEFTNAGDVSPQAVNFTYAAEMSTPAVVHVKVFQEVSTSRGQSDQMNDMLREYFGDPYGGRGSTPQPQGPQQAGSGSGVILTPDGYIATNNHVVKNADKIEIVLDDKRRYEAEVIGTDPTTDLALLKIEGENFSFLKYGNSDKVKIGEWVLAVGNPFDLTSTVTAGIVSAKARNINILRDRENLQIESFIQTDAAVNPGNSGGALVDLNGNLIGINTAIATPTGTYAGYSFAVPVDLVKKVMNDLLQYGEVQRALLGISITDVTAELAEAEKLEELEGVYVAGVKEESAADEAGIKKGDVILEIEGVKVASTSELQEIVARYRPGDKVGVKFKRGDDIMSTETVLQNKLGTTEIVKAGAVGSATAMGARLETASEKELKALRIESGVKVADVGNGKFKEQGIKKGFIITHIDKRKVESPAQVQSALSRGKDALLIEGYYPNGTKGYYAIGW